MPDEKPQFTLTITDLPESKLKLIANACFGMYPDADVSISCPGTNPEVRYSLKYRPFETSRF